MINLIPPKAKKSLLVEYWVRVSSVWLIVWAVALFASAAIILPAYVLIGERVEVYSFSSAESSQKVGEYEDVSTSLQQASQRAKIIVDESNLPVFSDYIALFESLQGQGVSLNKIVVSRHEGGLAPAVLAGSANNRQALAFFRDRLLDQPLVISVDLPISNLAEDKDIKFNIIVTLDNEIKI